MPIGVDRIEPPHASTANLEAVGLVLRPRALAAQLMRRLLAQDGQPTEEPRRIRRRQRGADRRAVAAVKRAHFELAGGSSAPGTARALVREQLSGVLAPPELDDALVLVSELVMNSVLHAGAGPGESLSIELALAPDRVRVEVCDSGSGFDPPAEPRTPGAAGGLGMLLLHRLAKSWGTLVESGQSCVWFELEPTSEG